MHSKKSLTCRRWKITIALTVLKPMLTVSEKIDRYIFRFVVATLILRRG